MKLMRYCILVILASSSLCYGFDNSFIKHAGLGIGKFSLGLICAYTGTVTLFKKWHSVKTNTDKNLLWGRLTDVYNHFEDEGFNALFCNVCDRGCSNMDAHLNCLLSSLSLIGVSIWGAWNSMNSGCDSLKKAYKSFKKVSKINKTSEETKTTSDTQEIGLQNEEKEFVD